MKIFLWAGRALLFFEWLVAYFKNTIMLLSVRLSGVLLRAEPLRSLFIGLRIYRPLGLLFVCSLILQSCLVNAQELRHGGATGSAEEIRPLMLGDVIPNSLWEASFQVVGHPEGKEQIKLEEYRDKKLIILDYWATWCGSCIVSMPKMYGLQEAMQSDVALLAASGQSRQDISRFLQKTKSPQMLAVKHEFTSIVEDKLLLQYFPKPSIPHVVIIDQRGKLRAITTPEELNEDVLKQLINDPDGQPLGLHIGRLDGPQLTESRRDSRPLYYSAVLPYDPTLDFRSAFIEKQGEPTYYYVANGQLIRMLGWGMSDGPISEGNIGLNRIPSRRIFELADPEVYDARNEVLRPEENHFTYEALLREGTTKDEASQKMHSDLQQFFGLEATIEELSVPCLILRVVDHSKLPFAKEGLATKIVQQGLTYEARTLVQDKPDRKRSSSYLQNYKAAHLLYMLNQLTRSTLPFAIDETGLEAKLDLDIVDDLTDIATLRAMLLKQGLDLQQAERRLPMFVLRDPKYKRPSDNLLLTKGGYVYADGKEGGQ